LKPPVFNYLAPRSLEQALALLGQYGDAAKILAGGQSLVPALNFRLAFPEYLIDLNGIEALQQVSFQDDGSFTAGALTRHRFFELSRRIKQYWPLLHHAVQSIAHVQIRNRGTIGGSLSHADPSAEWPALCLVCDAVMVIAGDRGERSVSAVDFSKGLFTTAMGPDEILVRIVFPAPAKRQGWGFQEVARRTGDFAIVGATCLLDLDDEGVCDRARVVIFGASDRPILMTDAATALVGTRLEAEAINQAAMLASSSIVCRADQQASAEYRQALVKTLTARALAQAATKRGLR